MKTETRTKIGNHLQHYPLGLIIPGYELLITIKYLTLWILWVKVALRTFLLCKYRQSRDSHAFLNSCSSLHYFPQFFTPLYFHALFLASWWTIPILLIYVDHVACFIWEYSNPSPSKASDEWWVMVMYWPKEGKRFMDKRQTSPFTHLNRWQLQPNHRILDQPRKYHHLQGCAQQKGLLDHFWSLLLTSNSKLLGSQSPYIKQNLMQMINQSNESWAAPFEARGRSLKFLSNSIIMTISEAPTYATVWKQLV